MEDYVGLLNIGFVLAIVLLIALVLRLTGFKVSLFGGNKKNKKGRKGKKGKAGKEGFYQQEDYVDDGGGDSQWEDGDMYAMKEGKTSARGTAEKEKKNKNDDKAESWDDY